MSRSRLSPAWLLCVLALPVGAGELADQLCGPDPAARESAAKALKDKGAAALPELQEVLAKPSALGGKLAAVHLLARIEGSQAAETLAQALSQDPAVAFAAAGALADQGDSRGEARLRDGLASPRPLLRVEAAEALDAISSAAAVPDLIRALEDEDEPVRRAASDALGDIALQDFDYEPANPSHDLPKDPAERKDLDDLLQWRAEQIDLLPAPGKPGKYVFTDDTGRERTITDPKQRDVGERNIARQMSARWNALCKRFDAKRLEARTAAVAQWRAWWEAHRSETPVDWLKAGLSHPKPAVRGRAATKIGRSEFKDLIPALKEALEKESDGDAAESEARALASFRDRESIPPLIAYMERMKDRKDVVSVMDLVLMDLTRVRGIPPSGRGWRSWWNRVGEFFEPGAVQMCGELEYAVQLKKAAEDHCTLEVRRWIPERSRGTGGAEGSEDKGAWLAETFEVEPGKEVGKKGVETLDSYHMKIQIDLLPGLTLDHVERDVRVLRKRPLKQQAILRAVFKTGAPETLAFEIPAS